MNPLSLSRLDSIIETSANIRDFLFERMPMSFSESSFPSDFLEGGLTYVTQIVDVTCKMTALGEVFMTRNKDSYVLLKQMAIYMYDATVDGHRVCEETGKMDGGLLRLYENLTIKLLTNLTR